MLPDSISEGVNFLGGMPPDPLDLACFMHMRVCFVHSLHVFYKDDNCLHELPPPFSESWIYPWGLAQFNVKIICHYTISCYCYITQTLERSWIKTWNFIIIKTELKKLQNIQSLLYNSLLKHHCSFQVLFNVIVKSPRSCFHITDQCTKCRFVNPIELVYIHCKIYVVKTVAAQWCSIIFSMNVTGSVYCFQ